MGGHGGRVVSVAMLQIQVETDAEVPSLKPTKGNYLGELIWVNLSSQIDNSSPAIIAVLLYI